MADVRLDVAATQVRFPRLTGKREYTSLTNDVYTDSVGGDRFGVRLTWNVSPESSFNPHTPRDETIWRRLSATLTEAAAPGNVLLFDLFDATSYKRFGKGEFRVAANAESGATEVMVDNASFAGGNDPENDFLLSKGSLFELGGELKQVVGDDVVGSPVYGRRQLRLRFHPALRNPVKRGAPVEADDPVVRMIMVGEPPAIGADQRGLGIKDVPWKATYSATFTEVDPRRPPVIYDPVTREPVGPPPEDPNQPPIAHPGRDQIMVRQGGQVELNGSLSRDTDGRVVSFDWRQISGVGVTIRNPNGRVAYVTAPRRNTTMVFQLTVTDNDGDTDTATTTVVVAGTSNEDEIPDAPINLVPVPSQGEVTATWRAGTTGGPTERCQAAYSNRTTPASSIVLWYTVFASGAGVFTRRFPALAPGDYTFHVRAVNGNGASVVTSVNFTIPALPPPADRNPGLATGLTAEPDVSTARLSWTAPTGTPAATRYLYRVGVVTTGAPIRWGGWNNVHGGATAITVRALGQGETHAWQVIAFAGLYGDRSRPANGPRFTTKRIITPLTPVTGLAPSAESADSITWTWSQPTTGAPARGYAYALRDLTPPSPAGGRLVDGWSGVTRSRRIVTSGIRASGTFRFLVRPLGAGGGAPNGPLVSALGRTTAAVAPMEPPPTPPSAAALKAAAGADQSWAVFNPIPSVTLQTVTVQGAASDGAGGYSYEWSVVGSSTGIYPTSAATAEATFTLTGVKRAVTLRLTVTDSAGATATDDVVVS